MNQETRKAVVTLAITLVLAAVFVGGLIVVTPKREPLTVATEPVTPTPRARETATTATPKPTETATTSPATDVAVEPSKPAPIRVNLLASLPPGALLTAQFAGGDQLKPAYQLSVIGQIFSDPQVREFMAKPKQAIRDGIARSPDAPDMEVLRQIQGWLIRHQSVVGVYFDETPSVVACVELGADADAARATMNELLAKDESVTTRSQGAHTVHVGPDNMELTVAGKMFVFASNKLKMDATLARLDGVDVGATQKSAPAAPVGERIGWMHADVPGVLAQFRGKAPAMGASDDVMTKTQNIIKILGIDTIGPVDLLAGFDGPGIRLFGRVPTSNKNAGFFRIYGGGVPLDDAVYRQVPRDVAKAGASRLDLAALWSILLEVGTEAVGKEMMEQKFLASVVDMEQKLGFKIKDDLIDSIGDTMVTYSKPTVMAGLPAETVVIVKLKDPAKFAACHEKLLALGNALLTEKTKPAPDQPPMAQIQKRVTDDLPIFSIVGLPFAPSWCVRGNNLFVALSPQGLNAAMAQADKPESSLLDHPDFMSARSKVPSPPFAFSFEDTRHSIAAVYAMVPMLATVMAQAGNAEDLPVDLDKLPPLESIQAKVFGGLTAWTLTNEGLMTHHYSSLGMDLSQMSVTSGVMAGMLLPALNAARDKARAAAGNQGEAPQALPGMEVPTL